ncbi:U-box domain-containing protein 51 [Manihot esculenta]|uniref:U-box domain-containing protein 51 n=1 Tax=Manihot esculenta TaxID=3983 RepID=UPI001CC727DC|nr:U-box domain-containing protein 51 [Manihot esculenta]
MRNARKSGVVLRSGGRGGGEGDGDGGGSIVVFGSGVAGGGCDGRVAVAIDKDKTSLSALKWAIDNLITRDEAVKLIHVKEFPYNSAPGRKDEPSSQEAVIDSNILQLFLPFRCYCRRRHVRCEPVVIEDVDVAKALTDYVYQHRIQILLLGAASKNGLIRLFKTTDIPANVLKWAPDFCTVYIVSKGKINTVRNATRPVPTVSAGGALSLPPRDNSYALFINPRNQRWYDELSTADMENSVPYAGRPSTDSNFFKFYENLGCEVSRETSRRDCDVYEPFTTNDNERPSWSSSDNHMISDSILLIHILLKHTLDVEFQEEYEEETRRLKVELKQTIDMYHAACKEALTAKREARAAKKKAAQLEEWKRKEVRKLEANLAEEKELGMVEREKTKSKVAIEAAEAVEKLVEMEVQKRLDAKIKALRENEEKLKVLDALGQSHSVLEYQSLFHMIAVLFLFYFYFSVSN